MQGRSPPGVAHPPYLHRRLPQVLPAIMCRKPNLSTSDCTCVQAGPGEARSTLQAFKNPRPHPFPSRAGFLLATTIFATNFVEVKRWQDFRKPGSQVCVCVASVCRL